MEKRTDVDAHRRAGLRGALAALAVGAVVVGGFALVDRDDTSRTASPPTTATVDTGVADSAPATDDTVAVGTLPPTLVTTARPTTASTGAPSSAATSTTAVPATDATGSTGAGSSTASTATTSIATAVTTAPPPEVDVPAYAVLDTSTGAWLAAQGADDPRPVGSIMKLLTTYVAMQAGSPDQLVTVPALQLDPAESSIGLRAGEQLSRAVLIRAMLIVSANDAARTLALDIGGTTDGFVSMMNDAARQLGLSETVAANPIGLDAQGAHSSARDVALLASVLMRDDTFRQTVARTSARLHGTTYKTTNDLLTSYKGADGIKTGHTTQAGYCLVGSATRDGRRIIVVVLGAASNSARVQAAKKLLTWAFGQG